MDHRVPPDAPRLHGLDALRLFLMMLGIPFHAALIYTVHASWLIRSTHDSEVLTTISILLHSFRMSVFFLLSGFFASLVIRRRGEASWLTAKLVQLGVPLVVCSLVLTPPQIFLASLSKFSQPMDHLHDAWNMTCATLAHPSGLWVLHLWFLIDLLLICIAFGLGWTLLASAPVGAALDRAERLVDRHPHAAGAPTLTFFLLATLAVQAFHAALHVREVTLFNGLIQVQSTLYFGSFFLFGAFLQSRPGLMTWFQRFSIVNVLLGCGALVLCVVAARSSTHLAQVSLMFLQTVSAICIARFLFWLVMTALHRPVPAIRRAADAAFTVYLLHHPLVALLGLVCIQYDVPPLIAWTGIVATTSIVTIAFHQHVVARSTVLSFLLNGRLPRRARQVATA